MVALSSPISTLLLLLLFATTTFPRSMANHHGVVRCNEKDRWILSIFRQGVIDPSNRLSKWSTEADCSAWAGIQCGNLTGRVTKLDLNLKGKYDPAISLQGTQLQSFDAWSYTGNPELCGASLTKNCTGEEEGPENTKQHVENEDGIIEKESLYLRMGVGYEMALWGICGSLFLNRAWRHAYFLFLNQVADQLYVIFMVKFNCKRRMEAHFS